MSDWQKRLKDRMKELGVTQNNLATSIGITQGAVSKYITGGKEPTVENFKKICTALSVSADWLLFGKLTSSPKQVVLERDIMLIQRIRSLPKDQQQDIMGAVKILELKRKL